MHNQIINISVALAVLAGLWSVWGFLSSRVEQTGYTVLKKTNGYEIREYPEHIVAEVKVQGPYSKSMNEGFGILAGYIFGGNTKKESIAMTAPVVSKNEEEETISEKIAMTAPVRVETENNSRIVSFAMPRSYTMQTLPIPDDSRINIKIVPVKKYAAMKFSWYRSDALIKRTEEKLLSALAEDGINVDKESSAYAGYNAPWTPPWMIRNEVMFEIK